MIFGKVNFSGFQNVEKTGNIAGFSHFPNAIAHRKSMMDFDGGFFFHQDLPYQPDDFYFAHALPQTMVLFAGNIYNRGEIINLLDKPEGPTTNPALVAALFLKYGPGFVSHLNGDFGICIYLPQSYEVYLYRDHLGIVPMLYVAENGRLSFSTDLWGFCRAFFTQETIFMDPLLSTEKLVNHLLTINPAVKKLTPGHYLHFTKNTIGEIKYWFPERIKTNTRLGYNEAVATARTLLLDAVAVRCDGRFVAGAHLSGGIDSSLVAPIARKNYPEQPRFYGFSWSPDGPTTIAPEDDERILVREIARMNNLEPVFCNPTLEDFKAYAHDFYNNLGYFYETKTLENARKLKVNLLLSGWGGNEFLTKLDTGIDSDLFFQGRFKKFFEKNPLKKPRKLARTLFYFILLPALGIFDRPMRKAYKESTHYYKKAYKKNDPETIRKSFFYRSRKERHLNFIYNYFISERTEDQHHIGFRNGVEFRYPLLDVRIVEFMLQVPSHIMVSGEKERVILRDIGKEWLPATAWDRKLFVDPVLVASKKSMLRQLGRLFMGEVTNWRSNPDLYFVDFDLLLKDVERAKQNPDSPDFELLYTNVLYFKMLHEFAITYRTLPRQNPVSED